jgi:starch phosphorylase
LQLVYNFSQQDEFKGKVIVLEEYDMGVGRLLKSGCDVWLNNPIRPHEASGTSGMKVPLHGGINCSIADGWWPEAYDGTNGWVIGSANDDIEVGAIENEERDDRDAQALYELLETEITREFYDDPSAWKQRALASLNSIPPFFNTNRMVQEYRDTYYGV